MQFSCDSCKAQLQIADERVRGKRLIARCRRCGAKIPISDPALGPRRSAAPPPASAAPPAPASSAPAPAVSAPAPSPPVTPAAGAVVPSPTPAPTAPAAVAASPPRSEPAAASQSTSAAEAASSEPRPDFEITRSMESAVLERALQASTAEAAAAPQNGATARQEPAPVAVPADGAIWFAMLHGKQTGPLTRAELDARANEGEVGPRTYLWRDGMDSWQRAKDVPELGSLFPQLPPAPGPASASGPAAKAGVASGQAAKTAAASSAAAKTAAPARSVAVPWPEPPRSEPPHSEPPRSEPARPEVARSEPPRSEPARSEPARSEPPLPDSVWVSTRADAQRAETGRSEPQAAEAERFDPLRSDSPWPETQQSSDPTAPMPRSVSADIIAEERAQTEEIARQLFASGEHSISQKNALDLARWASDEMGGHKTPARAAEQPKIAPALPATPMFTSATPRRMGRGALIAAIAVVVVAVVVMVIWALGGSSTDHPDEPGRPPQARSQPSPAPAPSQSEVTPEPAEAQAQAKPIEVAPQLTPSGPPQGPLTAEQLRRKLDEAKPALQLCVDRALPKEKVHVGRIHISTTIAPTGQVTAARIDKRTVDESALGTCLKRATQKITFPAFSGSPFDLDIPIVVTAGE